MIDFGVVPPGTKLYVPFNTFDSNDPSGSVTITGLATTDIEIYKDESVTQRASDAGYALIDTDGIDIDGTTGIHEFSVDLANNTTAGFFSSGSRYKIVVASVTVDAGTVNFIAAVFTIGYPTALLNTTIATLASQTSFTLTSGPAEDDALNGMWCVIHDVASVVQMGYALISDYTGSTKTVTLVAGTTFTAVATDNIAIMGLAPLQPTTLGATLDVTATGAAGIDWANIENPTTAVALSGTDIQLVDTTTTNTDLVSAAAVVNEWETQSQADPTGFHVNVQEWVGTAVTISGTTALPEVDTKSVSDDATAADNLELQYDTTGLAGDTFPATQAQVGGIGASSGGSLSFAIEHDNQIEDTIDNAGAVDKGDGTVGIPVTGHAFTVEDAQVTIAGSTNYNSSYTIVSQTTNEVVVTETFVSETFAGTETIVSTIKTIANVGTPTNTFSNAEADDGVYHIIANVGDAIDWVYQYDVGGGRTCSEIIFKGYLNSNNDTMNIQLYDFVGASWDTRGVIQGQNGTTNITQIFTALGKHTGRSGIDVGKVFVRFVDATAAGHTLNIDEMLAEAVGIGQTVGYAGGKVWINTSTGKEGTEDFVNGTADRPSLTLADALTLATSVGLRYFEASRDSTIAPSADFNNYTIYGTGYTFTLGGHDYAGTHVYHASPLTGVATAQGNSDHFDVLDSIVGAVTVDDAHFTRCGFTDTVTLGGSSGTIRFVKCFSLVAGSSTPILDFGAGTHNHNVTIASWQNGIEVRNFNTTSGGGTDLLSMSGTGQLVIASTCDGGTINLRGQWRVTDNSGGAVTITRDDVATSVIAIEVDTTEIGTAGAGLTDLGGMSTAMKAEVNTEADTALTDYDPPTNTEMEARTPTAAQLAYMVENSNTGLPVTFTTSGGSTTVAVLNLVDGGAGSATDDQYNGRLLVFTDGTLKGVVTDITDYTGSTTTATITAIPTAPTSSHNARLI